MVVKMTQYKLFIFIMLSCLFTLVLADKKQTDYVSTENITYGCVTDAECNHGKCKLETDVYGNTQNITYCECDENYINYDEGICNYEKRRKLVALLLSFFVGSFGVDWFYLSRDVGEYIVAGIFKLLLPFF